MSNPTWSNVPNAWVLRIFGGYMYVSNWDAGTISKINMSNPSTIVSNWATGLPHPQDLVINSAGTHMYVSNNDNRISKIQIMPDGTSSIVNYNWITGLFNPQGLVIDSAGTHIYVANNDYSNSTISKIQIMPDGSSLMIKSDWGSGLNYPQGLLIDSTGTYMYVGNYSDHNIKRILITDPNIVSTWATGLNGPQYLVMDSLEKYIYVTTFSNDAITKIEIMSDGLSSVVDSSYVSGLNDPGDIIIYNNFLYVANYGNGNIGKYALTQMPTTTPEITNISPSKGSIAGGDTVTITGTLFTGTTSVTFGGISATNIVAVNDTTITCTTPAHIAGQVGVVVTTNSGVSNTFLFFEYVETSAPMNNAVLLGAAAMPMKDLTSDNASSFAMGRRVFYETSQAVQVQARQKKFIGGNRDASSVIARRTAAAIGHVNTSMNSFVSSQSVSQKDKFTAIRRVRSSGYVPKGNFRFPNE